ncbi:MAG: toprim domain-containing protein [Nitrososphaera sp.]
MREKLQGEYGVSARPQPITPDSRPKPKKPKHSILEGVTIAQLAEVKGLNIDSLKLHGWADCQYKFGNQSVPAISIPYWDEEWREAQQRYRVALKDSDKYRWKKGTQIRPYGVWRLGEARAKGFIIIVEGETDSATLWQHGFPALGLPGANTWKGEWSNHLSGIASIYLWQEPDKAGQAVANKLTKWIPDLKIIQAPPNAKDPCELAQLLKDGFRDAMQALMDGAVIQAPANLAPQSSHSPETEASHTESHPTPDLDQLPYDMDNVLDQSVHEHQHDKSIPSWICTDCQETHRKRRKAAAEEGRADSLVGEVMAHQRLYRSMTKTNAEFCTSKTTGTKLCVAIANPYLFIDHDDLLELVGLVDGVTDRDGKERPMYKRIAECGLRARYDCIEHGTKKSGIHSCKANFDPNCISHMAKQLSRSKLPDLEGDAAYTSVWVHSEYFRGDTVEWQTKLVELMSIWERAIAYLARSKRYKGNIYFRSFHVYYEGDIAKVHWQCMIYEPEPGYSDYAAEYLAKKMDGAIEHQRRYQNGETAVTQLVADSFSHLVGIDTSLSMQERTDIFAAHYFATKGRHIFQGLGDLYKLLEELPESEPLVCDECGRPLKQILEPRTTDNKGYNSPTSPNYIYQNTG